MNRVLLFLSVIVLAACGPSPDEKRRIASVTCSIMSETRNMDAAIRVREMNSAREKIGGEPYLRGDHAIKEAFEFGICQELVLDENYDEVLQPLKDAKREKERIAAEKREEEIRAAAERQRIAESKPTVEEEFYPDGKLKTRINYQPKSDGGEKHGLVEHYYENGQLRSKVTYRNGQEDGPYERFYKNGQLQVRGTYRNSSRDGLYQEYYANGKLKLTANFAGARKDGPYEEFYEDGQVKVRGTYQEGKEDGLYEVWYSNGQLYRRATFNDGKVIEDVRDGRPFPR